MAANLEWKNRNEFGGRLYLGGWMLGEAFRVSGRITIGRVFRYALVDDACTESNSYQSAEDCMQDLETEVRRLLKEAGVVLA